MLVVGPEGRQIELGSAEPEDAAEAEGDEGQEIEDDRFAG